jgi:tetratricopeptide (TPR) repeat protein
METSISYFMPLILGMSAVIISIVGKVFNFIGKEKYSKGYGIFAITANIVGLFGSMYEYLLSLSSEYYGINGLGILNVVLFFSNLGFLINNISVFKEMLSHERYLKREIYNEYIKQCLMYCDDNIENNDGISDEEKTEICTIVGRYYFEINQYHSAVKYFQKALIFNPNNEVAKEYLALYCQHEHSLVKEIE